MGGEEFLIAGLGNPGREYAKHRHNVGFMVVDELARQWRGGEFHEKWQASFLSVTWLSIRVYLVKPLTYMNKSGRAVATFTTFYKLQPDHVLVVHDDLDMACGRIKLVKGGGSGGHNGIKSLVETMGSGDFYRLKIGIGRPGKGDVHPDFPVEKYVLSDFSEEERNNLTTRFAEMNRGIDAFLQGDSGKAMGILNSLK